MPSQRPRAPKSLAASAAPPALTPNLSQGERGRTALTPTLSQGERGRTRPHPDPLPGGEGEASSAASAERAGALHAGEDRAQQEDNRRDEQDQQHAERRHLA